MATDRPHSRVASVLARFPALILLIGLVIAAGAAGYGASAPSYLKGGGFLTDDAESSVAAGLLGNVYHVGQPNFYILLSADESVDSPAVRKVADDVTAELLTIPGLRGFASYWTAPPPLAGQLRSKDSRQALIAVQVLGTDSDAPALADKLAHTLTGTRDGVDITCGGYALIGFQIDQQARHDLILAESIAIPITAVVLAAAFGSLVAAMLPVLTGLFAAALSFAILRALGTHMDVSIFAMNMVTALSLALSIDYSLLMVARFREELHDGASPSEAMARTLRTAGRTVLFSAVTVACGLAALVVFPQFFLRTFAYAGLCVVASTALASVVLVPAALRLLGHRIDAADVRRLFRLSREPKPVEDNIWYCTAVRVARRPGTVALVVIAGLAVAVLPFTQVRFGVPDDRVIAGSASSRMVGDVIREDFPRDPAATAVAIMPGYSGTDAQLSDYAQRLSKAPDVGSVISSTGIFIAGNRVQSYPEALPRDLLFIQSDADPYSDSGAEQIRNLRELPSPEPALFAGAAASNVDLADSMLDGLPTAILLMALATYVLLFLFTRSAVLPLKAIVLNTLSLSATFGAIVWIFQDGHLAGPLDITPTGYIVPAMLILMFCLAFGMSMDYEVFVLSRIREEWLASDRTAEANRHSVALGIGHTGRIVTTAAVLMAIVFAAMVTSEIAIMQMFGLGLAIMALTDALIVRSLLVPAIMQFLGRWNWWPAHDDSSNRLVASRDDPLRKDAMPATTSESRTSNSNRLRRTIIAFRDKPWRIAALIVGLFVLWCLWALGSAGLSAKHAVDLTDPAKSAIFAGDVAGARSAVTEATGEAREAQEKMGSAPLSWVAKVPGVGRPLVSVDATVDVLHRILDEVVTPLVDSDLVNAFNQPGGGPSINLEALENGLPAVNTAADAAADINVAAAQIPSSGWLPPLDRAIDDAKGKAANLSSALVLARQLGPAMPTLLGADSERRYLLVFQTNSESRGTGGLMGGTAILTAKNGVIGIDKSESNLGLEIEGYKPIDLGPSFDLNYGKWDATSNWQNANFSANFPYAAQIWRSIWAQDTGQTVDGVIATDPIALSYLLEATGPIRLADGEEIRADNVASITLNEAYFRYPKQEQQGARKEYLQSISRGVISVVTAPETSKGAVAKALLKSLDDGRIMMWSADKGAEAALAQTALGHVVPEDAAPYANVVLNNGGGGKLDYYMERKISYEAGPCDGPTRQSTITVTLTNTAPPDADYPSYIAGRRTPETQYEGPPGTNRTIVMVYATQGAKLTSFEVDGKADFAIGTKELGHPMFATVVLTKPGQSKTLTYNLTEPTAPGEARVPVQPLTRPATVNVAVPVCG